MVERQAVITKFLRANEIKHFLAAFLLEFITVNQLVGFLAEVASHVRWAGVRSSVICLDTEIQASLCIH